MLIYLIETYTVTVYNWCGQSTMSVTTILYYFESNQMRALMYHFFKIIRIIENECENIESS